MSRSRSRTPSADGARPRSPAPQAAQEALLEGAAAGPVRRALWLDALDLKLRPYLPPALAAHARLANVDGAKLVFLVDSPVWHARLRLAAAELLDAARSLGLDVADIAVKTATQPLKIPGETSTTTLVATPPLSAAAREAFQTALASSDRAAANKKDES